jgi:hypothetical protein
VRAPTGRLVPARHGKCVSDVRHSKDGAQDTGLIDERVSLAQLTKNQAVEGGSQIRREGGQRYVAIKYSVPGRDLDADSTLLTLRSPMVTAACIGLVGARRTAIVMTKVVRERSSNQW